MPARSIPLGAYSLDVDAKRLLGDLGEAPLSPLSIRFLKYLAMRPGHTVSRTDLIDELWAGNFFVGDPALNRLASETRRAAKIAGSSELIETVQKSGYRLNGCDLDGGNPSQQRTGWSVKTLAMTLIIIVAVVVGLNWLMESAIGLIWSARHPN